MSTEFDISVALLHDQMVDKNGAEVTTSLTLNDIQDLARSAKSYGIKTLYIVHSSPALRKLAHRLQEHWLSGFGSTYNPDRKTAMESMKIVSSLDEALLQIDLRAGRPPKLIATSAHDGKDRVSYQILSDEIWKGDEPFLLLLGTGWGMSPALMARADYILSPIKGPVTYNHLSVRSACAIILDRLLGKH